MPLRGMNDFPAQRILHALVPIIAVKAVRRSIRFEFVYLGSDRWMFGVSGFNPSMRAPWPLRLSERGPVAHERLADGDRATLDIEVAHGETGQFAEAEPRCRSFRREGGVGGDPSTEAPVTRLVAAARQFAYRPKGPRGAH